MSHPDRAWLPLSLINCSAPVVSCTTPQNNFVLFDSVLWDVLEFINTVTSILHAAVLSTLAQDRIAPKTFGQSSLSNYIHFYIHSKAYDFCLQTFKGSQLQAQHLFWQRSTWLANLPGLRHHFLKHETFASSNVVWPQTFCGSIDKEGTLKKEGRWQEASEMRAAHIGPPNISGPGVRWTHIMHLVIWSVRCTE